MTWGIKELKGGSQFLRVYLQVVTAFEAVVGHFLGLPY